VSRINKVNKRLKSILIVVLPVSALIVVLILALSLYSKPIRQLTREELLDIRDKYADVDDEYIQDKYPDFSLELVSYNYFFSVHDLLKSSEIIVRAKYVGEGETVAKGAGMNRAYYVETFYQVIDLYKGEESDGLKANSFVVNGDTIITVMEYIGVSSKADKARLLEKEDCDYLLLIISSGEHLHFHALNSINKVDKDGTILWETTAIREAAKLENITNLRAVKKAAKKL
jgi:hypothetical protein